MQRWLLSLGLLAAVAAPWWLLPACSNRGVRGRAATEPVGSATGGEALAVALAPATAAPGGAAGGPVEIRILHTTDLHAHLVSWDYVRARPDDESLAAVATLIEEERAAHPCTLLVDTGDTIQGTALGSFYAREDNTPVHPMAAAMNALRYDAMAMGNHELNFGLAVLRKFQKEAAFPLLSANTRRAADGGEAFPPYAVRDVCGVKVAILGLVTPVIPTWERPEHIAGLAFERLIPAAQRYVPALRKAGAIVVAAVHAGPEEDLTAVCEGDRPAPPVASRLLQDSTDENGVVALARAVPGIDAFLTGHTHRIIGGRCVADAVLEQPGRFGSHLGVVSLTVEGGAHPPRVLRRWATVRSATGARPNAALEALAAPYHARVVAHVATKVGSLTAAAPGGLPARFSDNAVADLINEAQLEAARRAGFPADVSLSPVFSAAGLPAGELTLGDAFGIYPYDNTLTVLETTGGALRSALERAARYFTVVDPRRLRKNPEALRAGSPDHLWDFAAGVDYVVDLTRPAGQRVASLRRGGRDVADSDTLRVALNSYRARGGGGYAMWRDAKVLWSSDAGVRELVVQYLREHRALDPARIGACNLRLVPDVYSPYFAAKLGPARCTPAGLLQRDGVPARP